MKKVDVKKQPRLGLRRIFQFTIIGIRYRLFRSVVTMMVISVAIAFLMNSVTESLIKRSLKPQSEQLIKEERLAVFWVSKLTSPGGVQEMLYTIYELPPTNEASKEWQYFGREYWTGSFTVDAFYQQVKMFVEYLNWFESLSYSDRRQLVHQSVGIDILDYLLTPVGWDRFSSNLKKMRHLRFIDKNLENFQKQLNQWPSIKETLEKIVEKRKEAIQQLRKKIGEEPLMIALQRSDGEVGQWVREVGFYFPDKVAKAVANQAREQYEERIIERRLTALEIRRELAKKRDILPKDVSPVLLWRDFFLNQDDAEWVLGLINLHWKMEEALKQEALKAKLKEKIKLPEEKLTIAEVFPLVYKNSSLSKWFLSLPEVQSLDVGIRLTSHDVLQIAKRKIKVEKHLWALQRCADISGEGFLGLGSRMSWLLLVSLIVCCVGIANAMLMTVTERFREIATLKCLGALDGFIMTMFLIEAKILGIVGGLIGCIIGGIIGMFRMHMLLGNIIYDALQVKDLLIASGIAMIVGLVLAGVAAIYPSFSASKMAPMEAMRVD